MKLVSREYKVMLDHEAFGDRRAALHSFRGSWTPLRRGSGRPPPRASSTRKRGGRSPSSTRRTWPCGGVGCFSAGGWRVGRPGTRSSAVRTVLRPACRHRGDARLKASCCREAGQRDLRDRGRILDGLAPSGGREPQVVPFVYTCSENPSRPGVCLTPGRQDRGIQSMGYSTQAYAVDIELFAPPSVPMTGACSGRSKINTPTTSSVMTSGSRTRSRAVRRLSVRRWFKSSKVTSPGPEGSGFQFGYADGTALQAPGPSA